jgi:hypothetical protein
MNVKCKHSHSICYGCFLRTCETLQGPREEAVLSKAEEWQSWAQGRGLPRGQESPGADTTAHRQSSHGLSRPGGVWLHDVTALCSR